MRWQDHITSDPEVLRGKPSVKGTRLGVEFILSLCAAGWTVERLLDSYPGLTAADLNAVFAFAAEVMRDETIRMLDRGVA